MKKLRKVKKYWVEILLVSIALLIGFSSAFLYYLNIKEYEKQQKSSALKDVEKSKKPPKIYVDLAGCVKNPGLYEASNTERLDSVIKKSGGLTQEADKDFFAANFNLAAVVRDQQKIYIPSVWEVANGYSSQKELNDGQSNQPKEATDKIDLIDVNKATLEELDTLPGVGMITAQKVIDNRPYGALQELIDKKVFSKNSFEKVKEMIGIYNDN